MDERWRSAVLALHKFTGKNIESKRKLAFNGGELNTGDSLDLSLPPIKTVPLLSLQQAASWVII